MKVMTEIVINIIIDPKISKFNSYVSYQRPDPMNQFERENALYD